MLQKGSIDVSSGRKLAVTPIAPLLPTESELARWRLKILFQADNKSVSVLIY